MKTSRKSLPGKVASLVRGLGEKQQLRKAENSLSGGDGRERTLQREGRRCLQGILKDLGCGGIRAAMGGALPTFLDHQHSCQQPRWDSVRAKYNSATHLPPVPVAQRRPTVWESLHAPF